jgi:hypothetical protein
MDDEYSQAAVLIALSLCAITNIYSSSRDRQKRVAAIH